MKGKKLIGMVVLLVVAMLGISVGLYVYQGLTTPNVLVDQQPRVIYVQPHWDYEDLQEALLEAKLIKDPVPFFALARAMKLPENVKPGRYQLESNMSSRAAIRLLRSGEQLPLDVSFHNIRLKRELCEELCEPLVADADSLMALLSDEAFLEPYGFDPYTVMCMFVPNTYELWWTTDHRQLFDRMHQEYLKWWTDDRRAQAEELGLTPVEVSILASIVQAESNYEPEMPTVAGVYVNRLRRGIPLQADPTLVFAHGDFSIRRVLNVHKEIDSPYNTYKNQGLPPGPINLPEPQVLQATLNAEDHDYIFFVADVDNPGQHSFSSTLREHTNKARAYQRKLNSERIYR